MAAPCDHPATPVPSPLPLKHLYSMSTPKSTDLNLSKLWEIVEDRETWYAAVHGVAKSPQRSD